MIELEDTSDYDTSSRVLIDNEDVTLISDNFECKEKFRMAGAPWYKKFISFTALVTRKTLWHPRNCKSYHKLDALKWIYTYLTHCLRLVQQIANLRHARTEFERMKTDMMNSRSALKTDIENTMSSLQCLHLEFKECTLKGDPTYTISSDVGLLLDNFQRFQDLYSLYNDIINLINKTLADTNRTEKLAFLCGTVRKSDVFASEGYKCFEQMLYQLLGQVAECDKTKEYISSQLSFAKALNLDSTISHECPTSNTAVTQNFLKSGKICMEPIKHEKELECPSHKQHLSDIVTA